MNSKDRVPVTSCPHDSTGKSYFSKTGILKTKTCLDCKVELPKPPGGPTVICEKCWEPMGPLMRKILPNSTWVQYSICTVCAAEYCIPVPQTGKRIIKIK
jgi:hypothetical protein